MNAELAPSTAISTYIDDEGDAVTMSDLGEPRDVHDLEQRVGDGLDKDSFRRLINGRLESCWVISFYETRGDAKTREEDVELMS